MTYQKKVSEAHLISDEKYIIFHLSKSKTEEQNSWIDYLQRQLISFSLGCLDFKIQIKTESNYVFFKLKKATQLYMLPNFFINTSYNRE